MNRSIASIVRVGAILGATAALAASPAAAQDPEQDIAPGGLHVGVLAGFEGLGVESEDSSVTADADSVVYGIAAGYDMSFGSAFVGVEGEYSASDASTEFPDSFAGARDGLESNGQYYLGARAGFAVTPGIAAYGKFGYTALDTRSFTTAGSFADIEENATGLRYGGGVQVQLPGPLEARLEYRRSRYGDVGGDVGEVTTDQVVAGVGVRF
ncbi:outer membrane protein [Alteriqipengyuania lutimaris]|uniref:Porin family protein n=1 Tax=Alteriqipengyuania lutimaris TaxID=1538146 RepID=A0A395LI36_9SPHN|nr:outer membrane beta-barrel protein [Alteriqipengyuania lutimaris]MBB3034588.1 outer membrane immunogenic protein [Alteriqipengyuania lutimaris]RDS76532.1 porin family protein [Alteriqipengyuania lutimaris]